MYRFDPRGEPPEAAFRAIARDQIDEALAEIDGPAEDGRSVVHEVRRRCKKLRALLRLVRPAFSGFAGEDAVVRDAAKLLSHLRDAEVLRETVAKLRDRLPAEIISETVARLSAEGPRIDPAGAVAEVRARLAGMRERTGVWTLSCSGWEALGPGFRRTYRSARRRLHAAREGTEPAAMHEWRKMLKHHGFHLDLLKRSAPDAIGAEAELFTRLAELLGDHHDLTGLDQAAADSPQRFGGPETAGTLRDAARRRRAEIEQEAFALGRQLLAERPRAARRRFATYWKDAA